MGGDPIGRRETRVHDGNLAPVGASGRADAGHRPGLTTDERARLKQLKARISSCGRANEILRKASAFFAQAELDRRVK